MDGIDINNKMRGTLYQVSKGELRRVPSRFLEVERRCLLRASSFQKKEGHNQQDNY